MSHSLLFLLQLSQSTGKYLFLDMFLLLTQKRCLHGLVMSEAAD